MSSSSSCLLGVSMNRLITANVKGQVVGGPGLPLGAEVRFNWLRARAFLGGGRLKAYALLKNLHAQVKVNDLSYLLLVYALLFQTCCSKVARSLGKIWCRTGKIWCRTGTNQQSKALATFFQPQGRHRSAQAEHANKCLAKVLTSIGNHRRFFLSRIGESRPCFPAEDPSPAYRIAVSKP